MYSILSEIVKFCGTKNIEMNITLNGENNFSSLDLNNNDYTLCINQNTGDEKINEFLNNELSNLKNSFN